MHGVWRFFISIPMCQEREIPETHTRLQSCGLTPIQLTNQTKQQTAIYDVYKLEGTKMPFYCLIKKSIESQVTVSGLQLDRRKRNVSNSGLQMTTKLTLACIQCPHTNSVCIVRLEPRYRSEPVQLIYFNFPHILLLTGASIFP